MFNSFDFNEFGSTIRAIRKKSGLKQQDIQNRIGINTDTLRRIEGGLVVPRYDSIERLSCIYKIDLIDILKSCRINKSLANFYDEIDQQLIIYNKENFDQFKKDFHRSVAQIQKDFLFITDNEIKELSLFLECVPKVHSKYCADLNEAEALLIHSFQKTHPVFEISKFKMYKYSYLETRMLLLLSIIYANQKKLKSSNDILLFLLKGLQQDPSYENNKTKMILKLYGNIAYNYHVLENQKKPFNTAIKPLSLQFPTKQLICSIFFTTEKELLNLN